MRGPLVWGVKQSPSKLYILILQVWAYEEIVTPSCPFKPRHIPPSTNPLHFANWIHTYILIPQCVSFDLCKSSNLVKTNTILKTMNKLLIFLCFLVLLLVPLRSAGKDFSDRFEIIAKLQDLDVEEEREGDDAFEVLDWPSWGSGRTNKILVNVDGFGAVGDGVSDDTQVICCNKTVFHISFQTMWQRILTFSWQNLCVYQFQAFVNAWKQACSTPKSVLLVPEKRRYLVNATRFRGPCADKLVIQVNLTDFISPPFIFYFFGGDWMMHNKIPLCHQIQVLNECGVCADWRDYCSTRWAKKLGSQEPAKLANFLQFNQGLFPRKGCYWWLGQQMVGSILQEEQVQCKSCIRSLFQQEIYFALLITTVFFCLFFLAPSLSAMQKCTNGEVLLPAN